jgi:hypothetical protein
MITQKNRPFFIYLQKLLALPLLTSMSRFLNIQPHTIMRKRFPFLLSLALLLGLQLSLHAQNAVEDVVYLKNGGILRGSVLEQVPGETLKIETIGRNVFVVQMADVARIAKEPVTPATTSAPLPAPTLDTREKTADLPDPDKKISIIVEGNVGVVASGGDAGLRNGSVVAFGLQAAVDYRLSPSIHVGLGGGADQIGGSWFFPVFADFRYFITQRPTAPYFSASVGWAMGETYSEKNQYGTTIASYRNSGGLYASPTFGIRWNATPKAGLIIGVGPRLQMMQGAVDVQGYKTYFKSTLLLGNLKLGMVF